MEYTKMEEGEVFQRHFRRVIRCEYTWKTIIINYRRTLSIFQLWIAYWKLSTRGIYVQGSVSVLTSWVYVGSREEVGCFGLQRVIYLIKLNRNRVIEISYTKWKNQLRLRSEHNLQSILRYLGSVWMSS